MHRELVAAVAVLVLVLSSGCLGLVFGDGLNEEASPAAVDQASLDETGFEYGESQTIEINETVEAAGQERRIRATNHLTLYERDADLQSMEGAAGAFVVLSTPEFSVAGRALNPVATMDADELLERFRGDLEEEMEGDLRDIRKVDERTEPVLGVAGTVTTFAANTTAQGREIVVNVHVTKVRHEGDVVVGIGVHPEALQQQAPEVFTMMRGIEHPAELPSQDGSAEQDS